MEISDPKTIRALAHPLRLDLLELLATGGPATAAQCGRALGATQANCSFHLRQLAKYGFVEDAGPGSDRRERQWRVPDPRPTVRVAAGGDAVVRRQLERVVVEREMQAVLDHQERQERQDHESPARQHKQRITAAIATLSAEQAAELEDKWLALLEPYLATSGAGSRQLQPGQRHVRYFMAATPMAELDQEESEHATEA